MSALEIAITLSITFNLFHFVKFMNFRDKFKHPDLFVELDKLRNPRVFNVGDSVMLKEIGFENNKYLTCEVVDWEFSGHGWLYSVYNIKGKKIHKRIGQTHLTLTENNE